MNVLTRIFQFIKNFLFRFVNRKFLVFLFFLALSGIFWLIMTLNETMEKEISFPFVLTNVPKNMVVTSEGNDTVRVTVRDKGYTLAAYFYTDHINPIAINLQPYVKNDEYASISAAELQKMVYQQLYGSSRIVSIKPDKLEYYIVSHNSYKTLPVRFTGNITPKNNYFITSTTITPRTITVYATEKMLDSLLSIPIRPFNMSDISDTVRQVIKLQRIRGVKTVPDQVTLEIHADRLTEKTIEVPIEAINVPDGKTLRTFPSRISLKCAVGSSHFNEITENDFKVVVDYNSLGAAASDKCVIRLVSAPESASNVRLETNEADYLIEQ